MTRRSLLVLREELRLHRRAERRRAPATEAPLSSLIMRVRTFFESVATH